MTISDRHLASKDLVKYLILWGLVILVSKATMGAALIAFFPIMLFLLFENKINGMYFCLLTMIAFMIGNPFFFPKTAIGFAALRGTLVLLAGMMSIRVFGRRNSRYVSPLLGIIPYILFMVLPSAKGWAPMVSFLKLILFFFIYMALYTIANEVLSSSRANEQKIRAAVLSMAGVFVVGSVLLKPFPGLSLMSIQGMTPEEAAKLKSLYMGMSNHSQCLGPVVATIATLVMGDLLFSVKRFNPVHVLILLFAPVLVYWTRSRTAMGTYMIGQMVLLYFFIKSRGVLQRWKAKVFSKVVPLVILLFAVVMCSSGFQEGIRNFIYKGRVQAGERGGISDVLSSRQFLVDIALANFKKSPLIGNGFQVSEEMAYEKRSRFWDYLSAPIEKGVWIYAVLEEGGVVGFVLFAGFLICAFFKFKARKEYVAASMLVVISASNMGEFSFFSMSYSGGLQWTMVFAAAIMDGKRLKMENQRRQMSARMGMWS